MFRNNSTPLVAGAAVVAVLAALLFQGKGSTPADGGDANKPAGKNPAGKPEEAASVLETVGRYFNPEPKAKGDRPLAPVYRFFFGLEDKSPDIYKWPDKFAKDGGYKVECLIVTVPHPLKSGMGYWYDLTLDAVERAMENADFVLDRAQIPPAWQANKADATAGGADAPGVLLFRRPQAFKRQLAVVFLVPETPTGGMEIGPFRQSVRLVWSQNPDADIRIVGPYFSGSQESLMLALEHAIADHETLPPSPLPRLTFKIRNGSATAVNSGLFYTLLERAEIDYGATVLPDEVMLQCLYNYLDNPSDPVRGKPLPKVAILRESDTSYGQNVSRMCGTNCAEPAKPIQKVIEIPFPIHISGLQSAHTKELQDKLARLGLPRTSGGIPIPQEEGEKEGAVRRAIPSQSPLTTAAVNDMTIKNILAAIARERVRYVGLMATDPRDKILLATLIRENCPDVRLFTTGGDMLMAHPDFNAAMRGMIVASSYPLDAEPQSFGRAADNRRILFANQSFQGCFNAVLAHFADAQGVQSATSPGDRMLGYDAVQPGPANHGKYYRPTVWISAIGQNSTVVPVYQFSGPQLAEDLEHANLYQRKPPATTAYEPEPQKPFARRFSTYWLCCLVVLSAAVCWLLFRYLDGATGGAAAGRVPGPFVQRLCLAAGAFVLAGLYGWCLGLARLARGAAVEGESLTWIARWPDVVNVLVVVVCWAMLAVVAVCFVKGCLVAPWLAFTRNPIRPVGKKAWVMASLPGALQSLLFLAVAYAAIALVQSESDSHWTGQDNDTLYFERVTHPITGLSPLLPALLLGASFIGWCFFVHKEYYLLARCDVRNPFDGACAADQPYDALSGLGANLRQQVRWFGLPVQRHDWLRGNAHLVVTVLAGILILAAFGQVLDRRLPTLESATFDGCVYSGFLVAALLIGHTLGHFYFTWRRLKAVLHDTAWLPLGPAFLRLPAKVKQTFDRALYAQRPGRDAERFIEEQRQLLVAKLPAVATELGNRFPVLAGLDGPLAQFQNLKSAEPGFLKCLRILRPVWDSRPLAERYGPTAPADTDKTVTPPAGDWLKMAEDYLAIEITFYLSQFFVHLRNLLNALTIGALLLLLTVSLYPFQPQGLLLVCVVVLLSAVAGVAVWVLVGINRDEVMSHLAGNTPNKFTPDVNFLREIVQYVVPVLGLVMIQFPAVGSFVRSLVEPLLRVIR